MSPSRRAERRWSSAVAEHRAALATFMDALRRVPEPEWLRPRAPGQWSAAQVAEHLALAYEAMLRELEGGVAMRPRARAWQQRIFRWVLLPHILFHRSMPVRVRAPREARPTAEGAARPRPEALRRLRELGERFEVRMERARRDGGGSLSHPYFGRLGPVRALRFTAVHLEHHGRQLPVP